VPDAAESSMPNLAVVARALADERRAHLAMTLIDGRAWTPTELATHHRWPRSSMTEHLNVLIAAGLVTETRQGKHRYVRLADAEVAETIERLAAVSPVHRPVEHTLHAHRRNERLRTARTCYHHLAGRLGIQLRDGLLQAGLVSNANGYTLTPEGSHWFDELGYPVHTRGPADRRAIVRPCLDWTERVDHLAGIAADTLCHALTDLRWIIRTDKDRAVQISQTGQKEMTRLGFLP
jgi:DNA-binding transcriptional ArsR family regulator